jgi:hypothetical protein
MTDILDCCGKVFRSDNLILDHLIAHHRDDLHEYMRKKWGGETDCPSGCGTNFDTDELSPATYCHSTSHRNGKPYPVGRWDLRLAASQVAMNRVNKPNGPKETG